MTSSITSKVSVLFVCTHNSARSQMAEGLLRDRMGDRYAVYSAGTHPSRVHPAAQQVMQEIGIDISGHRSEGIERYQAMRLDYVVTVCDSARESCPYVPAEKQNLHHPFVDPSRVKAPPAAQLAAFRQARDEIDAWIKDMFSGG